MNLQEIEARNAPLPRDPSICRRPAEADEIHTLSAENNPLGRARFARPCPITSCEEPYIGDEFISRPPAAKKARMTSAQLSRASAFVPDVESNPGAEAKSATLRRWRGSPWFECALLARGAARPRRRAGPHPEPPHLPRGRRCGTQGAGRRVARRLPLSTPPTTTALDGIHGAWELRQQAVPCRVGDTRHRDPELAHP